MFGIVVTLGDGPPSSKPYDTWSQGQMILRDRLEVYYLHFHKTYKPKNW